MITGWTALNGPLHPLHPLQEKLASEDFFD